MDKCNNQSMDYSDISSEKSSNSEAVPVDKIVQDVLIDIEKTWLKNRDTSQSLKTGFDKLDEMLGGITAPELILLASTRHMGKTAFALNMVKEIAFEQNRSVLYFSLDHSKEKLISRLLCLEATVSHRRIRTGCLRDSDWKNLIEASSTIGKSNLIVDDTKMSSWRDLLKKCKQYSESNDLELIVIDDFQHIMEGEYCSEEEKEQAYTEAIKRIKENAWMFNVPIVILSQLPEIVDIRPEHRPVVSDLNEYGELSQHVDKIMLLYRDDFYKGEYFSGVTEIEVVKPSGCEGTINLLWSPTIGKYMTCYVNDTVEQ